MKCQIRKNSFESNSSSMHSFVIKKHDSYVTHDEVREDFKYEIDDNNMWTGSTWNDECFTFGRRPFDILASFYDKARYCVGNFHYSKGVLKRYQNKWDELIEVLKEYVGCDGIKVPRWHSHFSDIEGSSYNAGSDDFILGEWLDEKDISVREFLTNNKYIIILDGDEYGDWKRYKKSGLINIDAIAEEIPTNFNCDKTFWFETQEDMDKAIECLAQNNISPNGQEYPSTNIDGRHLDGFIWIHYKKADEVNEILKKNNIPFEYNKYGD